MIEGLKRALEIVKVIDNRFNIRPDIREIIEDAINKNIEMYKKEEVKEDKKDYIDGLVYSMDLTIKLKRMINRDSEVYTILDKLTEDLHYKVVSEEFKKFKEDNRGKIFIDALHGKRELITLDQVEEFIKDLIDSGVKGIDAHDMINRLSKMQVIKIHVNDDAINNLLRDLNKPLGDIKGDR